MKKNKIKSTKEVKNLLKQHNLIMLDKQEVLNSKQKINCMDYEGYKYFTNYNNLYGRSNYIKKSKFLKTNPYIEYNIQLYLNKNSNGTKLIEYGNSSNSKSIFACEKCQSQYITTWNTVHSKHKFCCDNCIENSKKYKFDFVKETLAKYGYKLLDDKYYGNNDNLTCLTLEGYKVHIKFSNIINHYKKNPYIFSIKYNEENYIYNINVYLKNNNKTCKALYYKSNTDNSDYVDIVCRCNCGEEYITKLSYLKRNSGFLCPNCYTNQSSLERVVKKWLDNKHINYEMQKTFDDCVYIRKLKFDFYLPKYNCCIEVDGKQHYKKRNDITEDEFEDIQKRDLLKNEYCRKNNILLIRINEEQIKNKNQEYKKILYTYLIKK